VSFDGTVRLCEWHGARVARVTAETATIVVDGREGSDLGNSGVHLDMTIRRGSPWVDCHFTRMSRGGYVSAGYPGLYAATPVAATDDGHSARLTTASSGWQWILASPENGSVDTTNGGISSGGGPVTLEMAYGVGAYHSSMTGVRTAANAYREYFAAQNETTHVGVRL
jgi:hypothetical protein